MWPSSHFATSSYFDPLSAAPARHHQTTATRANVAPLINDQHSNENDLADSGALYASTYVEPSQLPHPLTAFTVLQSARAFKPLKPLNMSRLRWNLLWLGMCLAFILIPLYLPFLVGDDIAFVVVVSLLYFLLTVWLVTISLTVFTLRRVSSGVVAEYSSMLPAGGFDLWHVLVLTIYKDDMDVVERTVESIASQTDAHRIYTQHCLGIAHARSRSENSATACSVRQPSTLPFYCSSFWDCRMR